jgi:dTDP-4-dehydrorhamnose reductase
MSLQPKIVITGANGYVSKHLRNFFNTKKIPIFVIARNDFQSHNLETKIIDKNYSELKFIP